MFENIFKSSPYRESAKPKEVIKQENKVNIKITDALVTIYFFDENGEKCEKNIDFLVKRPNYIASYSYQFLHQYEETRWSMLENAKDHVSNNSFFIYYKDNNGVLIYIPKNKVYKITIVTKVSTHSITIKD